MDRVKVLIADDDGQLALRLGNDLKDKGFDTKVVANGRDARDQLRDWKPKFFLVDLMLPESNGLEMIRYQQEEPSLRHTFIHTIVMSGHNSITNVHAAIHAGARDYMVKPFKSDEMLQRLVFHLRGQKTSEQIPARELHRLEDDALVLHLTDLVLKQALTRQNLDSILFNLAEMVAIRMDGVRCSIVQVTDAAKGVVVTSNDNKDAYGIGIDLNKYPEITQVMNFGKILAVENLRSDPRLKSIAENLREIRFNSLIVCPIFRQLQPFGVLSVRLPESKNEIADNEIRFVEIVGQVTSLVLGQGRHLARPDFWLEKSPEKASVLPFTGSAAKKR